MDRIPLLPLCVHLRSSAVALLCLGLAACGPKNFENDNDRLRAENLQLQRQVDELTKQAELRAAELAAARQQAEGNGLTPVEGAEPVQLAKIAAGKLSSAVDVDNDGNDDLIRLYLTTADGKGRFMPVAARVNVQVVTMKPEENPQVIAERTYAPAEFDAAYRSGFTGTHFTLEVPLPPELPSDAKEATAKVTLTEAESGVEHTTQTPVTIRRK